MGNSKKKLTEMRQFCFLGWGRVDIEAGPWAGVRRAGMEGEASRASLHLWEQPVHQAGLALGVRSGGIGGQARLWTLQVQTPRDDHKHSHLAVTWLVGGGT